MSLAPIAYEGIFMETPDITRRTAISSSEVDITSFELILCAVYEAFQHWQKACYEAITDTSLTGVELTVLLTLRLNERAKSLSDIERMMNSTERHTIQYCITKLLKLGLIAKIKIPKQKTKEYQVTEQGLKITTKFANTKNKALIDLFKNEGGLNLGNCVLSLEKIKAIYDKATRTVISYK